MNPLELRTRRQALGLSQEEFARLAGVGQATISQWEAGARTPRDPNSIHVLLCVLEDAHAELIDQIAELAEHASAVRDLPRVTLRTYASDADYWANDARAREAGLPSALHRTATAHAAYLVRGEFEIDAAIVT